MIAAELLRRLAGHPDVPVESKRSLLRTIEFDRKRRLQPKLARQHFLVASKTLVEVFDCGGNEVLPGARVSNPIASDDAVVARVALTTFDLRDFMSEVLGRNSVDDLGLSIHSSVHYSRSYCNAFWEDNRCVFGDGDGLIFKNFVSSNDFVAHEVMHGVTEYTAKLEYRSEAGALNESMSDVFGVVFRQWHAKQDLSTAEWSIGSDMMGPTAIQLGWTCLRHVAEPSASSSMTRQPSRYSEYDASEEPHINSGIPNRAFFLTTKALGLPSWTTGARIWYRALTSADASPAMTFSKFAALTVSAAIELGDQIPGAVNAVRTAWNAVEVRADSL